MAGLQGMVIHGNSCFIDDDNFAGVAVFDVLIWMRRVRDRDVIFTIRMEAAAQVVGESSDRERREGEAEREEEFFHDCLMFG